MNKLSLDWKNSKFGDRLIEALTCIGINEKNHQVEKIAQSANVTYKTAKMYLKLDKCPMNKYPLRLLNLSKGLSAEICWLYDGDGYSPLQYAFMKSINGMSNYHINKMIRLCIRLRNNDQKVYRLIELRDKGFISHEKYLSML